MVMHVQTRSRSSVRQAPPLDPGTTSGEREVSFELESQGGYLRTVTGTIAYIDEEADAYMVTTADGQLIRVPRRDIKKTIESVT